MPVRRSERPKHCKIFRKSSRLAMGLGTEVTSDHIATKLSKKIFSNYETLLRKSCRLARSNPNKHKFIIDSKGLKAKHRNMKSKTLCKTDSTFQTCKSEVDKPLNNTESSDCKLVDNDGVYIFSPIYRLLEDKITEEELPLFSFEDNTKEVNYICENITLQGC